MNEEEVRVCGNEIIYMENGKIHIPSSNLKKLHIYRFELVEASEPLELCTR